MQRRSVTTGLIAETYRVLHETVGVFFGMERGATMHAVGASARRVTP